MMYGPSALPSGVRAFCGEPGQFARDCEAVAEYAKAGKGKRRCWNPPIPLN